MIKKTRLTKKDRQRMWGEDTPYSQVNVREETRILGGGISRVFLVVDAEINPFTFEFVASHRKHFKDDAGVSELLKHAEYRGEEYGYVVQAGLVPVTKRDARPFIEQQYLQMVEIVIRMHTFVIEYFNLQQDDTHEAAVSVVQNKQFVWNPDQNQIETIIDDDWRGETDSEDAINRINNSKQYFLILAYYDSVLNLSQKEIELFARVLKRITRKMKIEVEDIESFKIYMRIVVRTPKDSIPADFVSTLQQECAREIKREIFKKEYLITDMSEPSQNSIAQFLGRSPE